MDFVNNTHRMWWNDVNGFYWYDEKRALETATIEFIWGKVRYTWIVCDSFHFYSVHFFYICIDLWSYKFQFRFEYERVSGWWPLNMSEWFWFWYQLNEDNQFKWNVLHSMYTCISLMRLRSIWIRKAVKSS